MAILSILSGSFCHGDRVAKEVAEKLGLERIDDRIFEMTSERYGVDRDRLTKSLMGQKSFLNKVTREREKSIAYLKLTLAELIRSDNKLIIGCVFHLIPRTIAHVLRVCVIANFDYRVKVGVEETGKSEGAVRKMIHEYDEDLSRCTNFLFEKAPYDESLYDIVLPMHDRSVTDAVSSICEHARSEPVKTTERSKQAAEDFVLAAQVEKELVEEGHDVDVFAEQGNVVVLVNEYVMRQKHNEEELKSIAGKQPGVADVTVRIGPKYTPPPINPWSRIEPPPKFLLVDDEKDFVETLSERLQTRDLESSIAYNGEEALEMLGEDIPDVMVLDLMMPGINGIEVLERVKNEHPEVEVIILTGHGSEQERERAEELGAFAYLRKPANIDELARVMKEAYRKAEKNRKQ